ncbi:pseudoazurin [Sinorhizobium fredii USDA 205]|uniref:Pseudoazurin n=1 Tax=Rhizobium fredii TaxID=380 RepID=A0A844AJD2_RHIFR|nr:pseudoazurin [Sinorhizobium fredii]ASY73471.1 Pseudoazurin [Sinorhizobium fredii CCBAU 83666]KSV83826.1 pseudoazurin [Sinorhizobium fredii USDA 205]MQX12521.1 pseudoazurin [Sinorhizobium fredii]GEC34924.1 pseudoazurin [Sinorhizobium fredii]GLS09390.1 pseudoazurin [Sinorhizobium fredii]
MINLARLLLTALIALSTPALASAETVEVKMLNRGEKGSMVFEPDFLALQPGDSVKFIATNKSHNAATIDGMVPDGHPAFKGKINEEIVVTFDRSGFYGIKCSPHYGMGMVMLIKVGDVELPQSYRAIEVPARAKPRFEALFAAAAAEVAGK